jgi:hypothetical protein
MLKGHLVSRNGGMRNAVSAAMDAMRPTNLVEIVDCRASAVTRKTFVMLEAFHGPHL